jgi:cytoskeletal protein RodZ
MKSPLVAGLVVILLAVAGGAYLLLYSPSTSTPSSSSLATQSSSSKTSISQTQTTQLTTQTTSTIQITNANAQVTVSALACSASSGTCVITLVNTGGTAVGATSCTLNGLTGVFATAGAQVPPGGKVNVSCSPAAGGAVPIPGFHVEGFIQLSNGASVHYTGNWS